jgi:hypothetical protein
LVLRRETHRHKHVWPKFHAPESRKKRLRVHVAAIKMGNLASKQSLQNPAAQYALPRARPCTRPGSPMIRRNPSASVWL